MADLRITTRETGGVTIVDLEGPISLGESSANLHQNLKGLVEEGKRNLLLNLGRVTAIDSSGLGTLVAGFATVEKSGGELKLLNLSPRAIELMTITKLLTVFDTFEDEQEAVRSFSPQQTTHAA